MHPTLQMLEICFEALPSAFMAEHTGTGKGESIDESALMKQMLQCVKKDQGLTCSSKHETTLVRTADNKPIRGHKTGGIPGKPPGPPLESNEVNLRSLRDVEGHLAPSSVHLGGISETGSEPSVAVSSEGVSVV